MPSEWEQATLALLARDGGRCGWCGKDLNGRGARHHRVRRRDGGDRLGNLVIVHPECHNGSRGSIHNSPLRARELGYIVPFATDPLTAPILIGPAWWLLDDEGGKVRTKTPEPLE